MTFGASSWLWVSPLRTENTDSVFSKIHAAGFDVVEIALEDPALLDVKVVKDTAYKYGLRMIVCGAFGPSRDLTNDDPAVHEHCLKYIETCLDRCVEWSSPIFAGPMYSAVGKARMVSPAQRRTEWNRAVENLRKVCSMAAERNLDIALEPLNRFESDLINTVDDLSRLIDDIGCSNAKMMLDSFHMNIEEPDPAAAIRKAGDKLMHFQVSENHRGIPGSGSTPCPAYFNALKEIGYTGTISIESFTPDNHELAGAVCIWKPFAENQDEFARQGLAFLKAGINSST